MKRFLLLISSAFAAFYGMTQAADVDKSPVTPVIVSEMFEDHPGELTSASPPAVSQLAVTSPLIDAVLSPVNWPVIEPEEGHFHFEIYDKVLDRWNAQGKRVVLATVSAGYPWPISDQPNLHLNEDPQSMTPEWVLKSCETHVYPTRKFYRVNGRIVEKDGLAALPTFWDPQYYSRAQAFVRQMGARYDKDPRIAIVRVDLGMMGEEKPNIHSGRDLPVGYTNQRWYDYCRLMIKTYAEAFPDKPLEASLCWAAYIYPDTKGGGKNEILSLLEVMKKYHVIFDYAGWDASTPVQMEAAKNPNRIWDMLKLYHQEGGDTALETKGWLTRDDMHDTKAMLEWTKTLGVRHINFYWLPNTDGDWSIVRARGTTQHYDPVELLNDYVSLIQAVKTEREQVTAK
jgi:Beta-galactosidase